MSVGKKDGTHDLLLESDATGSPTTSLSLMIADEETGRDTEGISLTRKRWTESRRPVFGVRQSQGGVSFADKDPQTDLIFSQKDWSGGALQPVFDPEVPNKVAVSSGLDMRWDNVATLGMNLERRVDFLLRNGGAENGTTDWTVGTGITFAATGTVHSGSAAFRATTDGSRQANNDYFRQTLANPTVYRNREIQVIAYVRRVSGTETGIQMRVDSDSIARTSATVTSSTYTFITATLTVGGSDTFVKVTLESNDNETGVHVFDIDDIIIIPTGGVACVGVASDADSFYGAFGRIIAQWDETNDVWDAVLISSASEFNSIVQFDGDIFAAFDDGSAYVYGSGTSWTTNTITAPGQDANFFAVAQAADAPELWKGILASVDSTNRGVYRADDPRNGGAWSLEGEVGNQDTDITGMYHIGNTIVVGKEEGLNVFKRFWNDGTAANDFENLTLEYEVNPQSDNFERGQESSAKLYLSASQQALFQFDGRNLLDISSLFFAPRLSDFGGRVRAMANDPAGLWLLIDTPTTDATVTKQTWLMNLVEKAGQIRVYTMELVSLGDINELAVNGDFLWALGRINNTDASAFESAIYRWNLPEKSKAPAFDDTPAINSSGFFETPRWDGNLPDDDKALISFTLFHNSVLDAEHTFVVTYGRNNAVATTTSLGTANTASTTQTTFFFNDVTTPETNAVCQDVQFRIAFASDDTVSPELYGFALHAILSPNKVRIRQFDVLVGDRVMMYNDQVDPTAKATMITNLGTLEDQDYPIYVTEDLDGDGTSVSGRWKIIPEETQRIEDDPEGNEVWRLVMKEVVVA